MYSKSNQAFVFTFGDQLLRIGDGPMFYRNKADAIRTALKRGLLVDEKGLVTSVESEGALGEAPKGPTSGFGKERTEADYRARIAWESWAEGKARSEGHNANADSHALSLKAYKAEMRKKFGGQLEGARKYNQKAYTHYVVVWPADFEGEPRGTVSGSERPGARIDSGWEFRDDAKDRYNEVAESEDVKAKIVAKVSLKSWGLNPDSNDDWSQGDGLSEGKTKLDLLLDKVKPGQHELTIDTEGYTSAQVDRVVQAAKARGFSASYDGRWVLIRDLRSAGLEGANKNDKLNSLDKFTKQYIATALWITNDESNDSGGNPLDENYGPSDLTHEALDKMISDSKKFQEENSELLARAGDASQNAHDFWLTRNGHGAGFWDRDYDEDVNKGLTDAAHAYGSVNLYVSGGKIHYG